MKKYLVLRLWICTCVIIFFGLVALYSASFQNVRVSQKIFFDQLILALVGIGIIFVFQKINFRRYYDLAYVLYAVNLFILVCVLFLGRDVLGARRWISFGGINFQPSELTKISLIFFLARYYTTLRPVLSFNLRNNIYSLFKQLIIPIFLTGICMFLIFKQPDLGTSLLMLGIFLAMAYMGGIYYKYLLGFLLSCLAIMPVAWSFLKQYQKDRLLVFLNPNIDPLGAGYTIIQSKIAVGSGRILGKGWLSGSQSQLNFLPERHTDFIFSVIGEEWGLVGSMFLVFMYFILIQTMLDVAKHTKDRFGILLVIGISSIFTLQVIINIGMVIGLFPIVGLTLPLVSYGRSSFLVFMIMIGILMNVCRERSFRSL